MSINLQTDQNLLISIKAPKDVALQLQAAGYGRARLSALSSYFAALASGTAKGYNSVAIQIGSTAAAPAKATGTVTALVVVNANTVSINGTALTATQHNSAGTVTCTQSGIDLDDTVTLNGAVFTAKAAQDLTLGYFEAATSDNATATSLAACINASTDALVSGIFTAKAIANVVTIRAVTAGSGGDSYTLASSDAQLAVSGATLAGGATVASNQFDFKGTDIQTATALAAAIIASGTALISSAVSASNYAGTITLSTAVAGDWFEVDGIRFTFTTYLVGSTPGPNEVTLITSDTAAAAAAAVKVNAHPLLKGRVLASSATTVLTIRQIPPDPTAPISLKAIGTTVAASGATLARTSVVLVASLQDGVGGNQATLASSGSTVAVSVSRLAGGVGGDSAADVFRG